MNSNTNGNTRSPITSSLLLAYAFQKDSIPYRKEFNRFTGKVTASILLQQFLFRAAYSNPFYKFQAPCKHPKYNDGDSWQEELGFSRKEFETAISRIGTKITKGMSKSDLLQSDDPRCLILYWTDADRVTWWEVNEPLAEKLMSQSLISSNAQKSHYQLMPESDITYYSENTTEKTSKYVEEQPENPDPEYIREDSDFKQEQPAGQRLTTDNSNPVNPIGSGDKLTLAVQREKTGDNGAREETYAKPETKALKSHTAPSPLNINKFLNLFNSNRGKWKPLPLCPPPRMVEAMSGYRLNFEGSEEQFFEFFQKVMKKAQSSGNPFYQKPNHTQIFNPDRLPLLDFWEECYSVNTQQQQEQSKPVQFSSIFGGQHG